MTPAQQLVAGAAALLLDFDGPVCDVFHDRSCDAVAQQMRDHLHQQGWTRPLPDVPDPIAVIAAVAPHDQDLAIAAHQLAEAGEHAALTSAPEIPGIRSIINDAHDRGQPVAIVSNNSATAIQRWLQRNQLHDRIQTISARSADHLDKLKPDPYLLATAHQSLDVDPGSTVFVGDSLSDAQAAAALGVPFIGLAKRPERLHSFNAHTTAALLVTMTDLATRSQV
jgi:beta-phosphoglucomutase-like phosphatase (HAD superfamily)